ncbi:MAG: TlpA family protein disulfide reductase [Rickettsiales bacterium]
MRHRLLPLVAFLMLALALYDALLGTRGDTPTQPKPLPAITLGGLDGQKTLTLSELNSDVVVVNFFASWCAPCLAEFPEFTALKKQFPKVKFYGVAWNDTPEILHPWFKKHSNPFDAVWLDADGKAAIALGIRGIPETYIVGRDGTVRYHLQGAIEPGMREEKLVPFLTALEAEHAPAK